MKENFWAYNLEFYCGVHLGNREGALEGTDYYIHSDTLFSAFCNGYRLLYGEQTLNDLLNLFLKGEYPFLLSSAFPFWEEKRYLPVPKNQIPAEKTHKRVGFVDLFSWARFLKGKTLSDLVSDPSVSFIPKMGEGTSVKGKSEPWEIVDQPRVSLDRFSNHPGDRFFYISEAHFREGSGLFFLVKIFDDSFLAIMNSVFRLLADEGLGGDRTNGKGHFKYPVPEEVILEVPDESDGSLTLSLYSPSREELEGIRNGFYDLIPRRGYIFSPYGMSLRRKPVTMFTEGSVFPFFRDRKGLMVNVTPAAFNNHQIFRAGYFFGMPCRLGGPEL